MRCLQVYCLKLQIWNFGQLLYDSGPLCSGVARDEGVVQPPKAAKLIFKRAVYFVCSTDVKLLSSIKGNSINNCDFFLSL